MDVIKIGKFIKELRTEKGITQEELAEAIGSTSKTISRWENGNYMPPVEMMMELGKYFNVSLNELLSGRRISETEYKESAEKNIAEIKKENERKSLRFFFIGAGSLLTSFMILFAVLYMITCNNSFFLVNQALFICMSGAYVSYYFSVARLSKGKEKNLFRTVVIIDLIGAVSMLVAMILNIIDMLG